MLKLLSLYQTIWNISLFNTWGQVWNKALTKAIVLSFLWIWISLERGRSYRGFVGRNGTCFLLRPHEAGWAQKLSSASSSSVYSMSHLAGNNFRGRNKLQQSSSNHLFSGCQNICVTRCELHEVASKAMVASCVCVMKGTDCPVFSVCFGSLDRYGHQRVVLAMFGLNLTHCYNNDLDQKYVERTQRVHFCIISAESAREKKEQGKKSNCWDLHNTLEFRVSASLKTRCVDRPQAGVLAMHCWVGWPLPGPMILLLSPCEARCSTSCFLQMHWKLWTSDHLWFASRWTTRKRRRLFLFDAKCKTRSSKNRKTK